MIIKLMCAKHALELDAHVEESNGKAYIIVEVCEKCIQETSIRSYNKGFRDAKSGGISVTRTY
jgi:hypothetical protein